jgi:hypothetical protein
VHCNRRRCAVCQSLGYPVADRFKERYSNGDNIVYTAA